MTDKKMTIQHPHDRAMESAYEEHCKAEQREQELLDLLKQAKTKLEKVTEQAEATYTQDPEGTMLMLDAIIFTAKQAIIDIEGAL